MLLVQSQHMNYNSGFYVHHVQMLQLNMINKESDKNIVIFQCNNAKDDY